MALRAWLAGAGAARPAEPRVAAGAVAQEAEPRREESFLRLARDTAGKPLSLDTAIVTYEEPREIAAAAGRREPLEVDLIGAVHLGSRSYFDTLDRVFTDYDAVLYELVAPENARVPRPGHKASGAIGSAQHGLTKPNIP